MRMHPAYEQLVDKAQRSHDNHRNPAGITDDDICRARLYCYAFRAHVIGTFHATRVALEERPAAGSLATAYRTRAAEILRDLANQAMDPVPANYRAVISTLYRYHSGVLKVIDSIAQDHHDSRDDEVGRIGRTFREIVEAITTSCGIHVTQDTEAPEQASFVVPGLGITIVPLVYGDHHSWNLAYLAGQQRNVPTHRHYEGVEIHLGYEPTHGLTVLGNYRALVDEGYAMPIPPKTDHGWVNTGDEIHHVPFIFGSLKHAGWGVFLDVEPQPHPVDELQLVDRDSPHFGQMIYLERHIAKAKAMASCWRNTLIPASVTNREGTGGLELSLTRINQTGYTFAADDFRALSVAHGKGVVSIEGVERPIRVHDHFGVPAGMKASLTQTGAEPLVTLDAMIKKPW